MRIATTDKDFGKDYTTFKRNLQRDGFLRTNNKDPIKDWQTWLDLNDDNLKDLTYYLLHELVFNEPLTSITKIIPFMDSMDFKVGVTLYLDSESVYTTNTIKDGNSPLFISAEDLVNVLNELVEEDENYMMKEAFFKIAWKLRIINELKDKQRRD